MPWAWDAPARLWRDGERTCEAIDGMTTTTLLNERGTTHGDFTMNALYAQQLRAMWRLSSGWASMPAVHKEALDNIALKVSRILSGQAAFAGHWEDVAGYAALALKACDPPPPVDTTDV